MRGRFRRGTARYDSSRRPRETPRAGCGSSPSSCRRTGWSPPRRRWWRRHTQLPHSDKPARRWHPASRSSRCRPGRQPRLAPRLRRFRPHRLRPPQPGLRRCPASRRCPRPHRRQSPHRRQAGSPLHRSAPRLPASPRRFLPLRLRCLPHPSPGRPSIPARRRHPRRLHWNRRRRCIRPPRSPRCRAPAPIKSGSTPGPSSPNARRRAAHHRKPAARAAVVFYPTSCAAMDAPAVSGVGLGTGARSRVPAPTGRPPGSDPVFPHYPHPADCAGVLHRRLATSVSVPRVHRVVCRAHPARRPQRNASRGFRWR